MLLHAWRSVVTESVDVTSPTSRRFDSGRFDPKGAPVRSLWRNHQWTGWASLEHGMNMTHDSTSHSPKRCFNGEIQVSDFPCLPPKSQRTLGWLTGGWPRWRATSETQQNEAQRKTGHFHVTYKQQWMLCCLFFVCCVCNFPSYQGAFCTQEVGVQASQGRRSARPRRLGSQVDVELHRMVKKPRGGETM